MDNSFFDLHVCCKCPFFPHFLQITPFAGHTSMSWLGRFLHLEQFAGREWPLPRPVSDVFLTGLFDIFTALIGVCLVSSPWRKTCCQWTISNCQIIDTALLRVRSASSCSCSDNLSSRLPCTSLSWINSSRNPYSHSFWPGPTCHWWMTLLILHLLSVAAFISASLIRNSVRSIQTSPN